METVSSILFPLLWERERPGWRRESRIWFQIRPYQSKSLFGCGEFPFISSYQWTQCPLDQQQTRQQEQVVPTVIQGVYVRRPEVTLQGPVSFLLHWNSEIEMIPDTNWESLSSLAKASKTLTNNPTFFTIFCSWKYVGRQDTYVSNTNAKVSVTPTEDSETSRSTSHRI